MPHAITIEIFQLLEEKLGKEEGRKVAEAIEIGFEAMDKKAEAVALQKKLELRDELTKELASKADIATAAAKLEGKMDTVKTELEGKIAKLDQKLNFLIVLMIIALTLMNPVVAEIIKRALKL